MDGGPSVPSAIPALELTRKRQTALSLLVKTEIFALNFYEHQCANIRFQGLPELQQQDVFLDRIYRAMGTLQMARTLNQDEFFDLVSLLRLGISLGESSKTYSDVGELIQKVQNATIAAAAGAEVTADAVDKIRAGLVRQALA